MKIAVFDNRLLPEACQQIQGLTTDPISFPDEHCSSEEDLIKRTGNAEIVLVGPWDKVTKNYLDACSSVKYVCLCGTSTTNIDLDELKKRNIPFNNVVDYGDERMAEFTFMQLTMLLRGVGKYQWKDVQHELMGKNVGIIGLGPLGKAIAHLALAYKMNVSYYSPHRKPEWEEKGLRYAGIPELLATNDIIVASGPSNVEVLGKDEFAHIRPGSIILQASSGNVFNREAFLDWIAADDGNFAIFDKAAGEDNYQAYKDLPRVIFAEVVAGDTRETLERLGQKVVENLKRFGANS